jgi:anti-sigma factor RsiW
MTDCPSGEIRDLLPDYVHGSLDAVTNATVAAHVATCGECAAEVELLRSVRVALQRAPAVSTARIAAALPKPGSRALRRAAWSGRPWRQAAAVAAIALGGLSYAVVRQQANAGIGASGSHAPAIAVSADSPATASARSGAAPLGGEPRAASPQVAELSAPAVTGLSDEDLDVLLRAMEGFEVVPDAEPASVAPPVPATEGD